jgi:hypothetical protein
MSDRKNQEIRGLRSIYTEYGRLQIGPQDIIRITLNLHTVILFLWGGGANL